MTGSPVSATLLLPPEYDISLEHVVIAEDVLDSSNRDQRAKGAAAAKPLARSCRQPPEVPS